MILFIDFCTCAWWIPWLLPAILGGLLVWVLTRGQSSRIGELEQDNLKLKRSISKLEAELEGCQASKVSLESELALLNGRIREYEMSSSSASSAPLTLVTDDDQPEDNYDEIKEAPLVSYEEVIGEQIVSDENEGLGIMAESQESSADSGISDSSTIEESEEKTIESIPPKPKPKKNIFAGLKQDNLQVIEGIGPKMNEILVDHGVKTWSDLASKSPEELRAILDSVNAKRYRIIDPRSWPEQARLAEDGNWEGLINVQKNLDSGRAAGATGETDSKVEKLLIKMGVLKRWKQDDLTAVEGIGPKISALLTDAGIDTWRTLANTDIAKIQEILDAAGKRYKLADPSSWPKQAEMAADGRWDDLEEYQDFLQGGK